MVTGLSTLYFLLAIGPIKKSISRTTNRLIFVLSPILRMKQDLLVDVRTSYVSVIQIMHSTWKTRAAM